MADQPKRGLPVLVFIKTWFFSLDLRFHVTLEYVDLEFQLFSLFFINILNKQYCGKKKKQMVV